MSAGELERFMRFVSQQAGGCWDWIGCKSRDGYGRFMLRRSQRAHRLSYEHFVGPLFDGMQIDHLCNNRGCVNPAHLEQVTPLENQRRAVARRETVPC